MESREVKKLLKKSKRECQRGFLVWHLLIKKHPEIKNTAVILMPSCEDSYNYYALLYMNQFLKKSKRDNAVLLTWDKRVIQCAKDFSENITSVIPFSRRKAELLMKYTSLYNFDDRLTVASLVEPIGRDGHALIGVRGLTEEELFAIGVYGLFPFDKEIPKSFSGRKFE